MGNLAIGTTPSVSPPGTAAPARPAKPLIAPERPANTGWSGLDMSLAPTFSAGSFGGAKAVLFGGRVEVGKEIVQGDKARVWLVGDLQAGIGNGLKTGIGAGIRGEVGRRHLNAYGTLIPQVNAGISTNGLTAGAGMRAAAGMQVGSLFGEIAKEAGTNMNMTSIAVGLRLRY